MEDIKNLIREGNKVDETTLPTLYMFKNLYDKGKGFVNVVYENKDYFAIVPSTPEGPRILDDSGAGPMSLIHVLVCPKKKIWNAVDVEQMKQFDDKSATNCGFEAVRRLRDNIDLNDKLKRACLENRLKEVIEKDLWSETVKEPPTNMAEAIVKSQNIEFSFHLYPNNSVNHLHMHVWCPDLATRSLDHQLAKKPGKNAPLDDVLKAIKEVRSEIEARKSSGGTPSQSSSYAPPRYIRTVPYPLSVQPTYEMAPASKPKANTHPRFNNLRH